MWGVGVKPLSVGLVGPRPQTLVRLILFQALMLLAGSGALTGPVMIMIYAHSQIGSPSAGTKLGR